MVLLPSTVKIRAQREALAEFLHVWTDRMMLQHLGPHLTCHEVSVLDDLLQAHGYHDAAVALIEAHAAEDEEGETHYQGEPSPEAVALHLVDQVLGIGAVIHGKGETDA